MAGTFTLDSTQIGQTIDTGCVLASMKLVSPPSGPLLPFAYDPVSGLPSGGRTMCLATTVGGKLRQFYNLDVWDVSTMLRGAVVPITPQPPPAAPLADLVLTAMPPGCQIEIVTV
jgi:hypothetical protein